MVGIDDAFDIMDALEKYQKLENMYFNKIDMHKCHIDLWDEKIVFQWMQNKTNEKFKF